MSTGKHWGEINIVDDDQQNELDVTADIEKSMNKFCLAEFDTDSNDGQKVDQIILNPMDPMVLQAISLHKYNNKLLDKISAIEDYTSIPSIEEDFTLPELVPYQRKHVRNSLNYINKDFVPSEEVTIPEISDAVSKQILVKCVAVLFAHIGYETTNQSVLDFMTDILESIMKQICYKLKLAYEDEMIGQSTGFPNAVERVFVDIGLGGIRGLHNYYENRVIKYVNILHQRASVLRNEYERLMEPKVMKQLNKINKIIRINIKREDDSEENPEIHFENADLGSSFETGFELLNTLEAGTNLEDEEINATVTTTPAEMETASVPFNKKKRTK